MGHIDFKSGNDLAQNREGDVPLASFNSADI